MDKLKNTLKNEIEDFRKSGHLFLEKSITAVQFKGKSGGMGVYAQRGGEKFMIRLRIPSGVLSYRHLRLIQSYTKKYDMKRIHFTTRQAIQLHDLSIDDVCDIMYDAIDHDLFTRGGGGNFPRNVALSPLSGVEPSEAFDVTPYALMAGNYMMERMTTYHLPRKLKIAFSNGDNDTACSTINDLGFMATIKDGRPYFQVYLAGGLGQNPDIALPYDKLIDPREMLYHVEAITRLFMAEGDYENKAQARTRYIKKRMGSKEFLCCYEKYLEQVKQTEKFDGLDPIITLDYSKKATCGLGLIPQKQENLFSVLVHPLNGQLLTSTLDDLVDYLSEIEEPSLRLTMNESMYIRNLTEDQGRQLLKLIEDLKPQTDIQQSFSCIGVPTCQIGIEQSQLLLTNILDYLNREKIPMDCLPSIHISGCGNSCSRHQVSRIGFVGKKKRMNDVLEDAYDLYLGGTTSRELTKLGDFHGTLKASQIPLFIGELALCLEEKSVDFMEYFSTYAEDFKLLLDKYNIS